MHCASGMATSELRSAGTGLKITLPFARFSSSNHHNRKLSSEFYADCNERQRRESGDRRCRPRHRIARLSPARHAGSHAHGHWRDRQSGGGRSQSLRKFARRGGSDSCDQTVQIDIARSATRAHGCRSWRRRENRRWIARHHCRAVRHREPQTSLRCCRCCSAQWREIFPRRRI